MAEDTDINIWKSRIRRAEGMQAKQHDEWNKAISLLNCNYKYDTASDERVEVNFVNWYISNLVPLVYFRDPFIFIKAKVEDWGRFAETLEKVVNAIWKDQKLKQQFKRVILSAFIQPPGWIHVGYTAKIDEDIAKLDENKEKGLIKSIKDTLMGVFKDKEKLPEQQGVLNQNIKEESIFADWIPSWNVLMPPGYHLVSKMPWLAWFEDVPIIDFLANPLYKGKKNIHGIYKDDEATNGKLIQKVSFEDPIPPSAVKDEITTIRLYHVWDRRSQTRKTFSMMSEEYHFEGDWPYDFEGFPIEDLTFEETLPTNKEDSSPYPYNIVRPILPQVLEQSNTRTQMSAWRRRASAIIMCQSDMATEADMNQIAESEAVQLIKVTNLAAFQMTQTPALPNEVFAVGDIIQQDLQMATNMGQIMFQAQPGQRTATQAKLSQSGLQLKISAKQDVIEDFTVIIARKIAQISWQFLEKDRVEELIGEKVSDQMWPELPKDRKERRRMINNMNIFIEQGSAAPPKDETVDRKQLLDFLQFAMAVAPERIKKDEMLKAGIKRWKFEKDVDKLVITNDEGEMQAAQEENSLLQSNIPCIVSPNNNHEIHLAEHAKAPPTTSRDQHMLDHAKFGGLLPGAEGAGSGQQAAQQGAGPQAGDVNFPKQSTNPENQRQGMPSSANINSGIQNKGAGSSEQARPIGV